MSDEIRVNRPPQVGSPMQQPMQAVQPMTQEASGSSKTPWLVLAVVVVVLIVVGLLFRDKIFGKKTSDASVKGVSTSAGNGYQAVFLTNGQVYFGKLSGMDSDFLTVKDIYYLQVVQQPPLQGSTQQPGEPAPAAAQPQISLVKLGQELHGPVDEMHIARGQVLFYEDLKDDGSVVKAIKDYKNNPSGAPVK